MTKGQRQKLLKNVKKQLTKESLSSKRAAAAAEEFKLTRWWRFYCFIAASAGIMGQLSSLLGLFHGEKLSYWFETDNHFVYQQITFVTSTLYCYNYYSLTTNRPSGSIPRILMCYPIVTFAYFTVFTGGQILGLSATEYMNHVLNQALHVYAVLFCSAIREYILRGGVGLILKDITFFIIAYYCWIWQCFFSLGKWPYDFLDLRVTQGNSIFGGVAAGCYIVVWVMFNLCKFVERKRTQV